MKSPILLILFISLLAFGSALEIEISNPGETVERIGNMNIPVVVPPITSLNLTGNLSLNIMAGSVLFSDGDVVSGDNVNFFWDFINKRLGIGTNSPLFPLTVKGTALFSAGGFDGDGIKISHDGISSTIEATTNSLIFKTTRASDDISFFTNSILTLFLDASNQKVGIGTLTPQNTLDVQAAGLASFRIKDKTANEHTTFIQAANDGDFQLSRGGTGGDDITISRTGLTILGIQDDVIINNKLGIATTPEERSNLHINADHQDVTTGLIARALNIDMDTGAGTSGGTSYGTYIDVHMPNSINHNVFGIRSRANFGRGAPGSSITIGGEFISSWTNNIVATQTASSPWIGVRSTINIDTVNNDNTMTNAYGFFAKADIAASDIITNLYSYYVEAPSGIVTNHYAFFSEAGDVVIQEGNLSVSGNITSENVFIPQYLFAHARASIILPGANEWTNVTFFEEETDVKFGISHTFNDATNDTFTIGADGIYSVNFNFDIVDTSVGASDVNVAGRMIYTNGTEILGSLFETDIVKQDIEEDLTHTFLVRLLANDAVKFQFISTDADVQIQAHATFGDHPDAATVLFKKIANI